MRKAAVGSVAALALMLPTPSASAHLPPDLTFQVSAGETKTWTGVQATGLNVNYFGLAGGDTVVPPGTCSRALLTRCETILLELSNPLTQEEIDAGETFKNRSLTFSIGNYAPVPTSDFDLLAFTSDAAGIPYDEIGRSGEIPGDPESFGTSIQTTIDEPTAYVLVHVVYFAVPNSSYDGTLNF